MSQYADTPPMSVAAARGANPSRGLDAIHEYPTITGRGTRPARSRCRPRSPGARARRRDRAARSPESPPANPSPCTRPNTNASPAPCRAEGSVRLPHVEGESTRLSAMHASAAALETWITPSAVALNERLCETVNAVSAQQHRAPLLEEQHQREEEEQVIVAREDVDDPEPHVRAGQRRARLRVRQAQRGLVGGEHPGDARCRRGARRRRWPRVTMGPRPTTESAWPAMRSGARDAQGAGDVVVPGGPRSRRARRSGRRPVSPGVARADVDDRLARGDLGDVDRDRSGAVSARGGREERDREDRGEGEERASCQSSPEDTDRNATLRAGWISPTGCPSIATS